MADSIARSIIAKVTPITAGPEYELAVLTGRQYWAGVMSGRPDEQARLNSQKALGKLIRHNVEIHGQKTQTSILKRIRRAIKR